MTYKKPEVLAQNAAKENLVLIGSAGMGRHICYSNSLTII